MKSLKVQKIVFYFAVLLTIFTFLSITSTTAQANQVIGYSVVYPHPYTLTLIQELILITRLIIIMTLMSKGFCIKNRNRIFLGDK